MAVPDTYRIVSSPVRLPGQLRVGHLAALVSADALCRWARARGADATWVPLALAGDLASQHTTERELAREGLDRATMGRAAFVDRVRDHEAAGRERLGDLLGALAVEADIEAATIDGEAAGRAAATAFIRLFEQGRLVQTERVVDTCPRCETVVDAVDADPVEVAVDCVLVRLPLDGGPGSLDVAIEAPELLPGAVAVAVPAHHPAAGTQALLPLVGRQVPVIVGADTADPVLVVPAHDAIQLEMARAAGLTPIEVLDGEGVVHVAGPLDGLPQYAARTAASQLLAEEGVVAGVEPRMEVVDRCRRCGTVLVPRLGRHWFLAMADLELAATDGIRDAGVTFSAPAVRDELLARAGHGSSWCLSHQVWAGQPVPVARCLDCGQVAVVPAGDTSCGKCMGPLEPDDSVLDARFVGSVAVLAAAGWPDDERAPLDMAPATTFMVGPGGVARWALPVAAVGMRLAGGVPFGHLAVNDVPDVEVSPAELTALVEQEGRAVVRTALAAGGLDIEGARQLVALVADPPEGTGSVDDLTVAWEAAFEAGTPQTAVRLLFTALGAGIPATDAGRLQALVAPVLGIPLASSVGGHP